MDDLILKIVAQAKAYLATRITEIQINAGFTDKTFQADITSVGWYIGAEWCAFSAILVWEKCLSADVWKVFSKIASGNSQQMARNCHAHAYWPTGLTPKVGCIVVWADGDSTTTGHTGLCTWVSVDGKSFTTSEGNTSSPDKPETRTGWTYAEHTHLTNQPHSATGFNFYRAIYPLDVLPN